MVRPFHWMFAEGVQNPVVPLVVGAVALVTVVPERSYSRFPDPPVAL